LTDQLAQKMRQLKGQGVDPNRRYWFPMVGYNYRMTNIQAALGLAQLEKADWHLAQRRRVADTYHECLKNYPEIFIQPELPGYVNSRWMTSIVLDENLPDRDWVMLQLAEDGIETRPFFYPMHILPMYTQLANRKNFPVADRVSARGTNLPSSASLTENDIHYVCDNLLKVLFQ
jgi:perosamine synthetase